MNNQDDMQNAKMILVIKNMIFKWDLIYVFYKIEQFSNEEDKIQFKKLTFQLIICFSIQILLNLRRKSFIDNILNNQISLLLMTNEQQIKQIIRRIIRQKQQSLFNQLQNLQNFSANIFSAMSFCQRC
ncbi:unnamed protein product [Paramecium sonneborni]|uniref:Uncharacterized protein n=1 Tax=Paramecium sonneborni TaxID=65129 RepID=A0A8S1RF24_9CILI|nr:unnamed protein product [Paramecium sonneborni]